MGALDCSHHVERVSVSGRFDLEIAQSGSNQSCLAWVRSSALGNRMAVSSVSCATPVRLQPNSARH